MNRQKIIVVTIAVMVGLLHFVTGPDYQGPARTFVNGYLIDILLPFAMFLVFGVANQTVINSALIRGVLVFLVGAIAEVCQYFDIQFLGSTFDILDFVMYGVGVLLGMVFEGQVLSRLATASDRQN